METWDPSTSTTFNFEYWAGDDWGYTQYSRFLEGRDRDGVITREASFSGTADPPGPRFLRVRQDDECRRAKNAWNRCMSDCVKERLNNGLWAGVAGGVAAARPCAQGAGAVGALGPYAAAGVFLGCMIGGAGTAAGLALVHQFGIRDACDSAGHCGRKPSC